MSVPNASFFHRMIMVSAVLCLATQCATAATVPKQDAATTPSATLQEAANPTTRPATWAKPLERPGLPNLFQVSGVLYRGAQPTAEGMKQLKAMGVKTVVDLRALHSDRDLIGDTGLTYEGVGMTAWHPEDEDAVRFLKIVTDKSRTPVFVHCQYGSDRTGTMCAIYRARYAAGRKTKRSAK